MSTPWQQVLEGVPQLNDPRAPFSYRVESGAIVGFWDVAKITTLGLDGLTSRSKEYTLLVRPDGDGTIDYTETEDNSDRHVGPGHLGASKSFFRGKMVKRSFGVQIGLGTMSHGEPTTVASWRLDTGEIKKPLFDYLERHGWGPKGFFARLFGR